MHHRLPHRRPAGLANLVAVFLLGMFLYRKGVEDGKKTAEQKSQPS